MEKEVIIKNIARLKADKNAVILAHNYQLPEIQDVADYLGDSLELSRISQKLDCRLIVFCGVKFMAETAKILSPRKKVVLPVENAGCPLADMITVDELRLLKSGHKQAKVVSYVNTSAEIKAESDVCCTSANAVKVVENIKGSEIIFIPDKNLGRWVKKNVSSKKHIIWKGFCHVHTQFRLDDLEKARKVLPGAEILVHPECNPEIQDEADYVLSTSGILKQARESKAKNFIIATEESLIYRLNKENPGKEFYSLGNAQTCLNMKKIRLKELLLSLEKEEYEITLEDEVAKKARFALEEMVKYI